MTAMKTMTCRWRLARLPPDLCTGSATAEFAIVLPSIIAIAGLGSLVLIYTTFNSLFNRQPIHFINFGLGSENAFYLPAIVGTYRIAVLCNGVVVPVVAILC